MSGLFESLSSASAALNAQRLGLDVAGQNIANINTPGYARRMLQLAELPPNDLMSAGRGVTVVAIRALRDHLVDTRLRREQGTAAYDSAMAEMLGSVEGIVGLPGSSLDAQLTAFFDSFSTLANDPGSMVARDNVVKRGTQLAQAFRDMTGRLGGVQADADSAMRSGMDEVNRLTAELAALNVDIATSSYDTDSIRDRQNVIASRLGELLDVTVLARQDGGMDVTLASGRAIVIGENSYALQASPNGMASVTLDGTNVTAELNGGRIGGLRQIRDVTIPGHIAQLDQLAYDVATAVNATHATGFDLSGAAGGDVFAALSGVAGAAGLLAVDPAIVANSALLAASSTGAAGDNGVARQLAALRDAPIAFSGTRTAYDAFSQFAYNVGTDVASARASANGHDQVVKQLQTLQAQTSGVSYDEEAAQLMRYQRAYEANARFFTTVSDALDVLMEMVK